MIVKQQYLSFDFRPDTLAVIAQINAMILDYTAQGFRLSVRQLYYQLVARGHIPNTERSYKRIASIINDGRLAGLIDWDAIEDRNRDIEMRARWQDGASIVQAAADSFHMDMWANQHERVIVIVEKAALAGVLDGVCRENDVPLLAARGYPSVSIVREMALEHILPSMHDGQSVVVLHLGDHDPSGIDMTRDLEERLRLFVDDHVDVQRIALSMAQIDEKNTPPNPAKVTDSRFADYQRHYGSESWELDALEPSYIVDLVSAHIDASRDGDRWEERSAEVEAIRAKLLDAAARFLDEEE